MSPLFHPIFSPSFVVLSSLSACERLCRVARAWPYCSLLMWCCCFAVACAWQAAFHPLPLATDSPRQLAAPPKERGGVGGLDPWPRRCSRSLLDAGWLLLLDLQILLGWAATATGPCWRWACSDWAVSFMLGRGLPRLRPDLTMSSKQAPGLGEPGLTCY